MSATDDLLDFLRARIAEDDRRATLARDGIRLHRVLAECEAKREILNDYDDHVQTYRSQPTVFGEGQRFGLLLAVARLASAYADHPDYDPEWKP